MNVIILSVRTGWHTDELCRALAERGHEGRVLPYEGLVARFGGGARAGLTSGAAGEAREIFDADAVLARIIPDGSLEQIIYRVDALHWMLFQSTGLSASKMREKKAPLDAYGDIRIQSTTTLPPKTLKSLAATGRKGPIRVKA